MKKFFVTIFVVTLVFGLTEMADVYALDLDLGDNITIWDKMGVDYEDQEVEPNCVWGQEWDLEAFFLKGSMLSMIGGYDFINGEDDPYRNNHYDSGDIFIDVNGDAEYGPVNGNSGGGNTIVANTFGYDYVLQLDFDTMKYSVYELTGASTVKVYFSQNAESNPWRYHDGGTRIGDEWGYEISYASYNENVNGLLGGSHNVASFDLGFLGADIHNFTAHFTMQCGNDDLIGRHYDPIPEPSTVLLLGAGLIGLLAFGRKRIKK